MRGAFAAGASSLALMFAAPGASAQDLPFGDAGEVAVVDELVVSTTGGPPWWTVADADTTVYVMASPGPIPRDVVWNNVPLRRRMNRANEVILPPGFGLGPGALISIPMLIFRFSRLDNEGERMERKLEPALRARFVAARERLGRPEERYGAHPPGMAALLLAGDAYDAAFPPRPRNAAQAQRFPRGPSLESEVRNLARDRRVRVERAATYGIGLINDILVDMRKPGVDCVAAVLDELDKPLVQDPVQAPDGGRAARAWAEGDVRPLLERAAAPRLQGRGGLGTFALEMGEQRYPFRIMNPVCAAPMTASKKIAEGFIADQVKAIERSLADKPGHSIAVVSATDLLRKDGVLDQLRAKGLKIGLPDVVSEDVGEPETEPEPTASVD